MRGRWGREGKGERGRGRSEREENEGRGEKKTRESEVHILPCCLLNIKLAYMYLRCTN